MNMLEDGSLFTTVCDNVQMRVTGSGELIFTHYNTDEVKEAVKVR